jgi:hypothetical protein
VIELVLAFGFDIHTFLSHGDRTFPLEAVVFFSYPPFGKGSDHFFITEILEYYFHSYLSCSVVLLYFEWFVIILYHVSHVFSN